MLGIPGPLLAGVPIWSSGSNIQFSNSTKFTNSTGTGWTQGWKFKPGRGGIINMNYRLYGQDSTGFRSARTQILISNDGGTTFDQVYFKGTSGSSTAAYLIDADIGNTIATSNQFTSPNDGDLILLKATSIVSVQVRVQNSAQAAYIQAHIDNLTVTTSQGIVTPSPFTQLFP